MRFLPRLRLFGESLRKVTEFFDFWRFFGGKSKTLKRYDYDVLQSAFREKKKIRTIINVSASFLFANWFEILCDDEDAQEFLNEFWNRHRQELSQSGVEGGLFGNTYLGFEHNADEESTKVKILHPGSVKPIFDKERPWIIHGWLIKTKIENVTIEETITEKEWNILVNGKEQGNLKGQNPYGILPIVHVAEVSFSNEFYGTGEIDEALYDLIEKYERVLEKGVTAEEYHGSPFPIFTGIRDFDELKKKMETTGTWKPGMGLFMPKDATASFLESKRTNSNMVELLKIIYYNEIIQSETPEYLLGVHIPAAHASTKEQRAPVERKAQRRRLVWTKALQQANKILLQMEEYHGNKSFKTYATDIEWGPIFESDKAEDADVLDKKSKAVSTLRELEIISDETARNALPEIIDDPDKEKQRIEEQKKASEQYKAPEEKEV
ncbi:MAG: phage portal protein [bacterium]